MINSLASRLKNPNTPNRRGCRQCKLTYRGYSTHAVELLDVSRGIIIILCASVYLATFNLWKILSVLEVCSLAMDSAAETSNAVSDWLLLFWPLFIEFGTLISISC